MKSSSAKPSKMFLLALPPELKQWLADNANRSGMSIASLIRYILIREKRKVERENAKN